MYELWKQEEKSASGEFFLACFAASVNQFYIYRQCTYIVFILQCQNVKKTTTKVSEKSRNMRRSGRFDSVLYNVRADTVTVSGNRKVIFLSVTVYCKSYLANAI